jgi:hypothetical protein
MGREVRRGHAAGNRFHERAAGRAVGQNFQRFRAVKSAAFNHRSASASAAICTPQTKLLMSLIIAPLPVGPRWSDGFAHRRQHRARFFQRGGIAADEKIQFAAAA